MATYESEYKRVKLSELNPMPGNHREHDERQVKFLRENLKRVGQTRPLIVNKSPVKGVENPIVAGNGLYEAMRREGWDEGDVLIFDMPEEEAIAQSIRDNRAYELGKVSVDALLKQIYELEEVGYDVEEVGYYHEEVEALDEKAGKKDKEKAAKEEVDGEIPFTEELYESHNYLVLYFDDEITFRTAQDVFGVKSVHAKGSKPGTKYELVGKGRVIRGDEVLKRLQAAEGAEG